MGDFRSLVVPNVTTKLCPGDLGPNSSLEICQMTGFTGFSLYCSCSTGLWCFLRCQKPCQPYKTEGRSPATVCGSDEDYYERFAAVHWWMLMGGSFFPLFPIFLSGMLANKIKTWYIGLTPL